MSYQATIHRAFQRYGQDQTIIHSGDNYTVRSLMTILTSGDQANFFDGNEAVGLVKPAALMFVPGDDPNAGQLEQSVFYSDAFGARPGSGGNIWTIRKIEKVRIGGVVVMYICACD